MTKKIIKKTVDIYITFFVFLIKTFKNKRNINTIRNYNMSFLTGIFGGISLYILIKFSELDLSLTYMYSFYLLGLFFVTWLMGLGLLFILQFFEAPIINVKL